jgi:pimeloyl-ACP methyl ester carboxylesterase
MADDAATILDELGIEGADIVGFSGGSVTAQELAIRHPERVRSLALVGTFGRGDRYFDATVRTFGWMVDHAPDPPAVVIGPLCGGRSYIASTFGMISSFSRLRSSSVFATGTSWNGGQRSGIVSPASL